MTVCAPPPIVFQRKRWSSDEVARRALAWRDALDEQLERSDAPVATVLANHPEAVALFFALSCFPLPLIVMPPELRGWRSAPALPASTRLFLAPALRPLAPEAERLGLEVTVLSSPADSPRAREATFLASPGVVLFTSGSTDLPRPVYRSMDGMLEVAATIAGAVGLSARSGVIAALPLSRSFGFNHCLMTATLLGCPLGLVERFEHNAVLALFASAEYHYWPFTPVMADILSGCASTAPPPAPPMCIAAGRLSQPLCHAFRSRFGVPLRQLYGTTEIGTVTLDSAPDAEVCSETAGRPFPGVEVRIGDDPRAPLSPGRLGRIWLWCPRSLMQGYGFPPHLEPPNLVEGWWPTPDVGVLDERGYLTVAGRLDDCVKTAAGHLVNAAEVAALLEQYPGVREVAVVPLETAAGPVLGVLMESAEALGFVELRRHLARSLPPWSQPRVLETAPALPRLESGRVDRLACIEILQTRLSRGEAR